MHSPRQVAGVLGSHVLPGIILLILGVAFLCVWELGHVTGGRAGGRRHRLIARLTALTGVVLSAASCVFMAARFIWIA
jgi:hypothetical protein